MHVNQKIGNIISFYVFQKKKKNENVAVRIRNLNKVCTCSTKKIAENNVTSNLSKLIDNLSSR